LPIRLSQFMGLYDGVLYFYGNKHILCGKLNIFRFDMHFTLSKTIENGFIPEQTHENRMEQY
jgi:hypothetical protein